MFTNDLPLFVVCVYGVVIDFSVRYILCKIYIVNYMWLDSLSMSFCGAILFLGWFCLVEPTIIIPPRLLSTTPYSLVCILAFLTGIRMAMISEPSQRLHSL